MEMTCDERVCYPAAIDGIAGLSELERNSALKMGENLDIIKLIAEAVREGKTDVGGDVFVMTMARNDDHN